MEWTRGWRDQVWGELDQQWDVLVIGGGHTGAGILRLCVHAGLKDVLVEAEDFASGTSSCSSKLVHGGLRYLKNARFRVTLESVREREYLLKQGYGLVNRLGFLQACLEGDPFPGWIFGAGLVLYDLMASQWSHRSCDTDDMRELFDDLLLRRVRLGLLVPNGDIDLLPRIRSIVQPELGWDDAPWNNETDQYASLWRSAYSHQ